MVDDGGDDNGGLRVREKYTNVWLSKRVESAILHTVAS